jgi:hypothetical protein
MRDFRLMGDKAVSHAQATSDETFEGNQADVLLAPTLAGLLRELL